MQVSLRGSVLRFMLGAAIGGLLGLLLVVLRAIHVRVSVNGVADVLGFGLVLLAALFAVVGVFGAQRLGPTILRARWSGSRMGRLAVLPTRTAVQSVAAAKQTG